MDSIIESFFIPDHSLQGSEFPVHLTWNKNKILSATIEIPTEAIAPKEIYNVPKDQVKIVNGRIQIKDFEKNGYVGLVFEAKVLNEPSINIPLKIIIETKQGDRQIIEKKIFLFRQHVVLKTIPNEIYVKQEIKGVNIRNKITLKNEGKGTAIIKLNLSKESDAIIKKPPIISDFVEKFCSTLKVKFNHIKKDFSEYSEVIQALEDILIDSVQGSFRFEKDYIEKVEITFDKLDKVGQENEELLKNIFEGIYAAYISSIHLITEIHGFLEYLKSIAKNKILLQNAASVIELKPRKNKLQGHLEIIDLANNIYKPIEIATTIDVYSKESVVIPLYSIFDWLE
ncbi:MAG: hypothetical protein QXZ70_03445 [Candidatus Bathyarchaeia archaeon]